MTSQNKSIAGSQNVAQTKLNEQFRTKHGVAYCGDSAELLERQIDDQSVDLIMTSPPFWAS